MIKEHSFTEVITDEKYSFSLKSADGESFSETEVPKSGDFAYFGYNQPAPPPPPRKKRGVLWTLLTVIVVTLAAIGIQAAISFDLYLPVPLPSGVSPVPSETLRPAGGGNASLEIVPVAPPTPTPDPQAERQSLTPAQVASIGAQSTVCVLIYEPSGKRASGSGVIMTADGYIITNCHVVTGSARIEVTLDSDSGNSIEATLVGMDALTDLAVIKIDMNGLKPAEFGDSDLLTRGDRVVVIGNPLGLNLKGTVTQGVVSAIDREIVVGGRTMKAIQTDASVNPGNSGGPLFNEYGQVVGIISSKIMGSFTSSVEGLAFAIPITPSKAIIDELISTGFVKGRATIGISEYEETDEGVRVLAISQNADAYKQGLRVGDIITHADGERVYKINDIIPIRDRHQAGDTMTLDVLRDGREVHITFKLDDAATLK